MGTPIDRAHSSPPFATPAGLTAPILLKWLLVWEDPIAHTLWFAKALPRVWLADGESLFVDRATTAYGRVSFSFRSAIGDRNQNQTVAANLTLPADWGNGRGPAGGCRLRLRVPSG